MLNSQNNEPASSIDTGSVSTQASIRLRTVSICKPVRFAAMVPATPEGRAAFVEKSRPIYKQFEGRVTPELIQKAMKAASGA